MKSDLYTAIAQIAAERGIPRDAVLSSVQSALTTVYKRNSGREEDATVELDSSTGEMQVVVRKAVVEVVEDPDLEISQEDAKKYTSAPILGEVVKIISTPENF